MKTLTITDARKNLGKLLTAAARGEDIGIISGADVIALRKVEVESTGPGRGGTGRRGIWLQVVRADRVDRALGLSASRTSGSSAVFTLAGRSTARARARRSVRSPEIGCGRLLGPSTVLRRRKP